MLTSMVKGIHLQPHTLGDSIVLDGIRGVNAVLDSGDVRGCITGGMSVQCYLPVAEHRKTVDLDYSLLCGGGSTSKFRETITPLTTFLQNSGYSLDFRKKGFTYELYLQKNGGALLMQHHRRTTTNYEHQRSSLEREAENSHFHNKFGISFRALSPEDIILHKLSRILIFSGKYNLKVPFDLKVSQIKTDADQNREDVLSRLANVAPHEVAKLRLYYDCFDVKSLVSTIGVNMGYFKVAADDWHRAPFFSEDEIVQTFHKMTESS